MSHRKAAIFGICCVSALAATGSAFGQLPKYPASKPGDAGYIAEDAQHARLVGRPGPSVTLQSIEGGTIDLAGSYGRKPIYLKLWATYCIPCRAQMPKFEQIYDAYKDRIQIVAVDAGLGDDPAKVRTFVQQANIHMPVAIDDGSLGAWLDLEATPFHLVIGRDGRIAYAGHQDGAELDAALTRVLASAATRSNVETTKVESVAKLKPGDLVPEFELRDANNAALRFARGVTPRPRAILFTAVWCESYLKTTEPDTVEACRRTREQADQLSQTGAIDWLGVVAHLWTTPKALGSYETRMKPRLPMAVDTDGMAFRLFGIRRLPAVALIGADGRLVRMVGPDDIDLGAAVAKLARGN
jgi:thiol-disulfide isomerase/thioredoxin